MKVSGLTFSPQRFRRPKWESRDCAVRAVASGAGISYADAHFRLWVAGRKNSTGTQKTVFEDAIFPLGFVPVEGALPHKPLKDIAADLQTGRWLIGTPKHYFAVVDGAICDTSRDLVGPGTTVRELYKLNR